MNSVPSFNLEFTSINPLFFFIILYTIERPRPVPFFPFVVKYGSNILDIIFSSIPQPLSIIEILANILPIFLSNAKIFVFLIPNSYNLYIGGTL